MVKAFNAALTWLIAKVQLVVNAIGKLLGWQMEISDVGIPDTLADASDSSSDLDDSTGSTADNLEDASDSAKSLKNNLLGIDELNIISQDDSSSSDSDSGSDTSSSGSGDVSSGSVSLSETTTPTSDISNWYELGRKIANALTEMMEDIDWDSIYAKARTFGHDLADFLNGLITPSLFSALGKTIAGALNTALNFLDAFGERFNWKNFGNSLAAGLNTFFKTFDFELLGSAINKWAKGLLTTLITFLKKTDWEMIGTQIGKFLVSIDFLAIGKKVGQAIWEAINAGFKFYKGLFKTAPLETVILTLVGLTKLLSTDSVKAFASAIVTAITNTKNFGLAVSGSSTALSALPSGLKLVATTLTSVKSGFETFVYWLGEGLGVTQSLTQGFNTMSAGIPTIVKGIGGVITAFAEFMLVKDGVEGIVSALSGGDNSLVGAIAEVGVAVTAAGVILTGLFGVPAGLIIAGATAAVAAIAGLYTAIEEEIDTSSLENVGKAMSEPGGVPIEDLADKYTATFESIGSGFEQVATASEGLSTATDNISDTNAEIDRMQFAMENGAIVTEEKITRITELFNQLYDDTSSVMSQEYDVILSGLSGAFGETLAQMGVQVPEIIALMDSVNGETTEEMTKAKQSIEDLSDKYESGEISKEEYYNGISENLETLQQLTQDTDELSGAVDGFADSVDSIDTSSLVENIDGVYELNLDALSAQFDQLGDAYSTASGNIESSSEGMTTSIDGFIQRAEAIGDTEAVEAFKGLAEDYDKSVEDAQTSLDKQFEEYGNVIQRGIVDDIPTVIDEALADYEDRSWLYKFTHSEEDHVQEALDKYQSEVIDPVSEELEKKYEELGIDGETWASDAAKNIIDSLYETTTETSFEGASITTTTLKSNYEQIIDDALSELPGKAEGYGKDVITGIDKGMTDNTSILEQTVGNVFSKLNSFIHDNKEMPYGSPNKKAIEYGEDMVEGLNVGIDNNSSSTESHLSTWFSGTISPFFADTKWSELGTNVFNGITNALGTLSEWFTTTIITPVQTSFGTMQTTVSTYFSTLWTGIQNVWASASSWFSSTVITPIQNAWSTFKTDVSSLLSTLWTGIKNIWSAAENWFKSTVVTPITTLWSNFKTNVYDYLSKLYGDIQTVWGVANTWFSNNVTTPIKNLFSTLQTNVYNYLKTLYSDIQTVWNSAGSWFETNVTLKIKDKFETLKNTIRDYFLGDNGLWSKISSGAETAFENAVSGIKGIWNKLANAINEKLKFSWDAVTVAGQTVVEAGEVSLGSLPTFATGGFPEDGLFFANHSEMVGGFSNGKTAVANNAQIVEGIRAGVYDAVTAATSSSTSREEQLLEELIQAVKDGRSIQIDGRELVKEVANRQSRNGYSLS